MFMRTCWLICSLVSLGCGGSAKILCKPDPISGSERCQQTGGGADAALTGGVAGGMWAAKGCTINGCEPPFTCNAKSKLCERQRCGEAASCPPGYECQDQHCR
jgi:hypothetical protein